MIAPNTICFSTAISACEKGLQWQQVLVLLAEMPTATLDIDAISYNSAINACDRAGQWQASLRLLQVMVSVVLSNIVEDLMEV